MWISIHQFIKRISYEIINTDVKREYPYLCPHCSKKYLAILNGNENLDINEIEFVDLSQSVPINDKSFHKIIDFYLFHCPARITQIIKPKIDGEKYTFNFKQTCKRGVTFLERGIKGYGLVYLKNAMVNVSVGW